MLTQVFQVAIERAIPCAVSGASSSAAIEGGACAVDGKSSLLARPLLLLAAGKLRCMGTQVAADPPKEL